MTQTSWTLITGASKGLGKAISLELAKNGQNIVVHYCNSLGQANQVVQSCRDFGVMSEALEGDFSSQESTLHFVERYLEKFSSTVNLVYNVGNYFLGKVSESPTKLWYDLFETNLHAPFLIIKNLLPSIRKQKGSIMNIGVCGLGRSRADIFSAAYTISKEALWSLTLSLAKELAPDFVRVNMVSPGLIEEGTPSSDAMQLPMQRPANRKEIAEVIAFFMDPKNEYITGQNIEVAGGLRL